MLDFRNIVALLDVLLGKDIELLWTIESQLAFDTLKEKLISTSILKGPN
jgi:hypothetical protein